MIVLATLGVAICGVTLWRGWSPVPWWIGAAGLAVALIMIAWRRGQRRVIWVAGAVVVGLAVAAVPIVEPLTRAQADVAWSLEGSEEPVVATESLILTVDANRVLRARAVEDGVVAWEHELPQYEHDEEPPVHLADGVALLGADALADPGVEMVAVDVATGEELWTGPAQIDPLVRDGSTLAAYTNDEELGNTHRGIDLDTGEVLWTNQLSVGNFRSIPKRIPGPDVPTATWLADDTPPGGDEADRAGYTVTRVRSGEQLTMDAGGGYSAFGAVGEQLVVHEVLDDPEQIGPGDVVSTEVTAYDLNAGGEAAWQVEHDIHYQEWMLFEYGHRLNTVDGSRLVASPDGAHLEVLDLTDGSRVQAPAPSGARFTGSRPGPMRFTHVVWVRQQTALAPVTDSRLAVVDLETGAASLLAEAPSGSVQGTVLHDGRPVPVWEEPRSALFGREYDQLTALDLSDADSPELADLGALPDGTVAGTYSGRVVLVTSEEIEDAADDEPQSRATEMHVLEPFDDAP